MIPLFLVVHIFLGATLSGSAVVVALSLGLDTMRPLIAAAAIGFLISLPASWIVAKRIREGTR